MKIKEPPQNKTTLKQRVLYADTDQMGVVYHATYLRWFEAGRAQYMRLRGRPYSSIENSGIQLPVVEANLLYSKPARYDDVITVEAWVEEITGVQVRFAYRISKDNELLVSGFTRHASLSKDEGRLTRLPDEIHQALIGEQTLSGDDI